MSKKAKKQDHKGNTYKDVALAFLCDGMVGVERMNARRNVVAKAIEYLKLQGRNTDALEAIAPRQRRGREEVKVGTERVYLAQQIGDKAPFLRVPLNTLGAKKGGKLKVRFEADRIILGLM